MSEHDTDRSRVELTLLDGEPNGVPTVRLAWLPMLVWDGVRVCIKSARGLTLMERFVIECLMELGDCGADDLQEVASIPLELANWLLTSLEQRGLALHVDRRRFTAQRHECVDALEHNSIPIQRDEVRTFLWFPETQ